MKASSFLLHLAMDELNQTIFSSEFDDIQPVERRWKILPWWIKAFTWLFLIIGALSPFILIAGLFGTEVSLSLYGLESTGPLSITGLCLIVLYMFKGIAAYGLWAEKNWGITVAEADGLLGIAVCIAALFINPHSGGGYSILFYFRLDLIILAIYLTRLYRLQDRWNAGAGK